MLPHVAYPRYIAAYSPKYAAIFNITNRPEFEDALGIFSWQAQRVLTRTFQSLEKFEHGVSLWSYQPNGELTDWQQNIARYAVGNSRLCLALGASFAAPLLSLLNEESGGFHLMGDSPPLWNLPPLLPACP